MHSPAAFALAAAVAASCVAHARARHRRRASPSPVKFPLQKPAGATLDTTREVDDVADGSSDAAWRAPLRVLLRDERACSSVGPVVYVSTRHGLDAAAAALRGAGVYGVDVEHTPHSFHGYVTMVQIASPAAVFVVDVLVADVRAAFASVLGPVLASSDTLKVLHAGGNDVRWLMSNFGTPVRPVFDTAIAASAVQGRVHPPSLAALAADFLGVAIDKSLQRADWRLRPLPADMLAYAAGDAHFLLPLAARLVDALAAADGGGTNAAEPRLAAVLRASAAVARGRYDAAAREAFDARAAVHGALRRLHALRPLPPPAARSSGGSRTHDAAVQHSAAAPPADASWGADVGIDAYGTAAVRAAVALERWRHATAVAADERPEAVLPGEALWGVACAVARAAVEGAAETAAGAAAAAATLSATIARAAPSATSTAAAMAAVLMPAVACDASVRAEWTRAADAVVLEGLYGRGQGAGGGGDAGAPSTSRGIRRPNSAHHTEGTCDAASASGDGRGGCSCARAATPPPSDAVTRTLAAAAARATTKAHRAASAFVPRAAPLYANISLHGPDGVLVACIDARKAAWYVAAGAAVLLDPADAALPAARARAVPGAAPPGAQASVPSAAAADGAGAHRPRGKAATGAELPPVAPGSRLRMLRPPRGPGHGTGDAFYVEQKRNECVVCGLAWRDGAGTEGGGGGGGLVRLFVVPHAYRQHFPLAAKSYSHHDIVLTCPHCHHVADRALAAVARVVSAAAGVPLGAKAATAAGLFAVAAGSDALPSAVSPHAARGGGDGDLGDGGGDATPEASPSPRPATVATALAAARQAASPLVARRGALPADVATAFWAALREAVARPGAAAAAAQALERAAAAAERRQAGDGGTPGGGDDTGSVVLLGSEAHGASGTRGGHRGRGGRGTRVELRLTAADCRTAAAVLAAHAAEALSVATAGGRCALCVAMSSGGAPAPAGAAWCALSALASPPLAAAAAAAAAANGVAQVGEAGSASAPGTAAETYVAGGSADGRGVDAVPGDVWDAPAAIVRAVLLGVGLRGVLAAPADGDLGEAAGDAGGVHGFGVSGLPLAAEARLDRFVRAWREGFIQRVQPRHLPDGWRVSFPLLQADARRVGKKEGAVVVEAFRAFGSPLLSLLDERTGVYVG